MTLYYQDLANRVLRAFNEVPFADATAFAAATGFHADVKDAINMAIFDIYTEQEIKWPFAKDRFFLNTTAGVTEYDAYASASALDWNSFYIDASPVLIDTSIERSGTTATAETGYEHLLEVGDTITIYGAVDEPRYNASWTITNIVSQYIFQFTVPSTYADEGSGLAKFRPVYSAKKLHQVEYEGYLDYYLINDINRQPSGYGVPDIVVRDPSNNIIISPTPNRHYRISYDYYRAPSKLSTWGSATDIPDRFEQVIIDKALHYAYMFRDNLEQAQLAEQRYQMGVTRMRKNLIPQPEYLRYT